MSPRKKPKSLSSIDLDKLRDLYLVQNLTITDTAEALDISFSSVWKLLGRIGVPRRGPARYGLEEARELYFDQGWTLQQIGDKFGVTRQAIHLRLTNAGFELRSVRKSGQSLDPVTIRELFVDQKLTKKAIAETLGTTIHYVNRTIREYGFSRPWGRRKQFERELIEDLYLRQRLFVRQIAVKLGISPDHVTCELKRHNITFRNPPGVRIVRPDRDTLDRLYTEQGLTFAEIGQRVGISSGTVIKLINEYGIERRPAPPGLSSLGVDRNRLYELHVTNNVHVAEIARMFKISKSHVYKSLRLHGIEIQVSKITRERGSGKK